MSTDVVERNDPTLKHVRVVHSFQTGWTRKQLRYRCLQHVWLWRRTPKIEAKDTLSPSPSPSHSPSSSSSSSSSSHESPVWGWHLWCMSPPSQLSCNKTAACWLLRRTHFACPLMRLTLKTSHEAFFPSSFLKSSSHLIWLYWRNPSRAKTRHVHPCCRLSQAFFLLMDALAFPDYLSTSRSDVNGQELQERVTLFLEVMKSIELVMLPHHPRRTEDRTCYCCRDGDGTFHRGRAGRKTCRFGRARRRHCCFVAAAHECCRCPVAGTAIAKLVCRSFLFNQKPSCISWNFAAAFFLFSLCFSSCCCCRCGLFRIIVRFFLCSVLCVATL